MCLILLLFAYFCDTDICRPAVLISGVVGVLLLRYLHILSVLFEDSFS